ncbi:kinase-like domain-containing protein [Gigaspora rosea]|uniref:Kinase-like domain-containing protein n=1 Tax=Gigaspora rosea TaxID=44941 RepID=A0A397VL50_9GLOM|nr:kinase-like domain-containing protein [Gigaspora rosea]
MGQTDVNSDENIKTASGWDTLAEHIVLDIFIEIELELERIIVAFLYYQKSAEIGEAYRIVQLIIVIVMENVFSVIKYEHVALKVIHNSNNKNVEIFIQELKYYCDICYEIPSYLNCHGVSRDDTTKNYVIVLKHARKGSLRQNLETVSQSTWKDKLNILYCIASDLEVIHSQELIHRDLDSEGEINDVMPYIAPEVLHGNHSLQAADIYSLGAIMTELAMGKKAFDGERPEFGEETPKCYVKLAKRCMESDPNKRPTATNICHRVGYWLEELEQDKDNEINQEEIF